MPQCPPKATVDRLREITHRLARAVGGLRYCPPHDPERSHIRRTPHGGRAVWFPAHQIWLPSAQNYVVLPTGYKHGSDLLHESMHHPDSGLSMVFIGSKTWLDEYLATPDASKAAYMLEPQPGQVHTTDIANRTVISPVLFGNFPPVDPQKTQAAVRYFEAVQETKAQRAYKSTTEPFPIKESDTEPPLLKECVTTCGKNMPGAIPNPQVCTPEEFTADTERCWKKAMAQANICVPWSQYPGPPGSKYNLKPLEKTPPALCGPCNVHCEADPGIPDLYTSVKQAKCQYEDEFKTSLYPLRFADENVTYKVTVRCTHASMSGAEYGRGRHYVSDSKRDVVNNNPARADLGYFAYAHISRIGYDSDYEGLYAAGGWKQYPDDRIGWTRCSDDPETPGGACTQAKQNRYYSRSTADPLPCAYMLITSTVPTGSYWYGVNKLYVKEVTCTKSLCSDWWKGMSTCKGCDIDSYEGQNSSCNPGQEFNPQNGMPVCACPDSREPHSTCCTSPPS